ncbi:hypothetical protein DXG01_014702 [Tephrocybe rancida]|nr:hypothetical protein DXG01_014702 [Tephrocybe rancida]
MSADLSSSAVVNVVIAAFLALLGASHVYASSTWKQRGSLPDYARLSGVPLPQSLWAFDGRQQSRGPTARFDGTTIPKPFSKKLEPELWLELESTYFETLRQQKKLYAEYPRQSSFAASTGAFRNRILDMTDDTAARRANEAGDSPGIEPKALEFCSTMPPEDFPVIQEIADKGEYELRAGIVGRLISINDKLKEIHGIVPDCKEGVDFSMDRSFIKMPYDKPIQCGSP